MEIRPRSEKKKTEIMDAAVSLFIKHGVKKVSIDEIAIKAGASKVTIYKYFTDKDTLYRKVFEYISGQYAQLLDSSDIPGAPLSDRMIMVTQLAAEFISSGHKALCEELSRINLVIQQDLALLINKQSELIKILIREGHEHNIFKAGITDDTLFHYIKMGLCYYQYDSDYRHKIEYDTGFRQRYMTFLWSNIFESAQPFGA